MNQLERRRLKMRMPSCPRCSFRLEPEFDNDEWTGRAFCLQCHHEYVDEGARYDYVEAKKLTEKARLIQHIRDEIEAEKRLDPTIETETEEEIEQIAEDFLRKKEEDENDI